MSRPQTLGEMLRQYESGARDFRQVQVRAAAISRSAFEGVDFRGARLDASELLDVTFSGCNLTNVSLRHLRAYGQVKFVHCDLTLAVLSGCALAGVTFESCRFEGTEIAEAKLHDTTFTGCSLRRVSFVGTQFHGVSFERTTASECRLGNAIFVSSSLDPFCDAARLKSFSGGPAVDWRSILRSAENPNLPQFLIYCGVPELLVGDMIRAAKALDRKARRMRSTFISYGTPDETFAHGLHNYLERNGVRTFFFPKDAVPGQKLHDVMRQGINAFDRVILICSEASLNRPGVRNEIEETLTREARTGGGSLLIPITRDSFIFTWNDPLAQPIRDRVVADFRNADVNTEEFREAFARLLVALRTDEGTKPGA